ncbi:peptidase S1 and S6, chymotrypsin/Hap [Ectocarpus siliculosus]|uniref:Peptidase S1 and S6, chymotrypsin/Hap n=1 Tax=Ectocarpus siliculosus TaxID=2880 RepID=D8LG95_ECTSI|nr:peptidase S1 and S6, chymotrypsin/Hap [Ectocarpus siliculosus]|eukprot:CBN78994.1 peptidase S1 and S6, chymotrypsin/Hap [Ectocarpus siliculosus]
MAGLASASVSFEEKIAQVYDVAPKVRIAGSGFDELDAASLKLSFAPKLKEGEDYKVDIQSSTVMVLNLQSGKKWMSLDDGASPTGLYLSSAKVGDLGLLEDSVQIATIVPSPTVEASSKPIYMQTTPKLIVNGTNFNTKITELYFDPPLQEGVVIQKKVLSPTQISITKNFKYDNPYVWADEPGPLKIVAINTGGGRLSLNSDDGGIVIAEVQADLDHHGVTVQGHESLDLYQSSKSFQISGSGFVDGTKVRFANALRGGGTNFTITDSQPELLTLELAEGSKWRKNPSALPGALVLLAADSGDGWVPLGPTQAKAGSKVATVFEDPSVEASDVEIYRTHTHELQIRGTGFNKVVRPVLDFEPALDSTSVYVEVVNRTMITLSLSTTSSQWTADENVGDLTIKGLDTGAGMVTFDSPVTVAKVVSDSDVHESGVQVYPSYGQPKYQSSKQPLQILGTGFKGEPVLNFDPPIWAPDNYTVTVVSETELKLDLADGSLWSKYGGTLMVKGINVGDGEIELGGGKGVKVATILEDPTITEGEMHIYTTHTKHFPVHGTGFQSVLDPSRPPTIVIDGISSSNYKIQDNWRDNVMTLSLLEGAWATVPEGEVTPIKIMSIDTGAGTVSLPSGVQIANVREDSSTNLCEDSCSFAADGQCDEPGVAFGTSSSYGGSYMGSYYSDMLNYNPYGLGWGYDDDANSFLGTNDYSGMYRYAGYDTTYQYYGMTLDDDGFFNGMSPCDVGTDCTDCGVKFVDDGTCTNTCQHARDGYCDDPRASGVCPSGTDCQDCGPWGDGNSNFTLTTFYQSSSWFDDDDWEMLWNDDGVLYGQEMNAQAPYKRDWNDHEVLHKEAPGAGTIFVDVLWAMVVLVGCSMSLGGCMVAYRHFKAGGGGAPMYLPVQAAEEVELSRRAGGAEQTPDVVRIG